MKNNHKKHSNCNCEKKNCTSCKTQLQKNKISQPNDGVNENGEKKPGNFSDDEDSGNHHQHHKNKNTLTKSIDWLGSVTGLKVDHSHAHEGGVESLIDHEHGEDSFTPKVWILILGLILTVIAIFNTFAGLGHDGGSNIAGLKFLDNQWIWLTAGIVMFILMGVGFLKASITALIKKEISEDILVAISGTVAFLYSFIMLFIYLSNGTIDSDGYFVKKNSGLFFREQIEIMSLIYMGRFIEEWLSNKVSNEMASLESLKVKDAVVLKDGKQIPTLVEDLKIGDIVVVKVGLIVPTDGVVVKGETTIDESSLTGESKMVFKNEGSSVYGGTISSNGLVHVRVTKLFNDSFISKIIQGVNDAQNTKPKSQKVADKIARILVPSVLIISTIVFFAFGFSDSWSKAVFVAATVLVISCPCSFAMTTPLSILMSSTTAKREGVIFSSPDIFEVVKKIDVIAFDKTGTLTEGKFEVVDHTFDEEILPYIISGEHNSNHPLALSIVNHFKDLSLPEVKIQEIIGKGLNLKAGNKNIDVGSLSFVLIKHPDYKEPEEIIEKRRKGSSFVYGFNSEKIYGYFELKDNIKETTFETIELLKRMNIEIAMITGDQKDTAISIANELGISEEHLFYEVDPSKKSEIIKEIQEQGKKVAFVGDGINDTIALMQSDLGIAIGEGSDAAIEVADIVLNKNDLTLVAYAVSLSRQTLFSITRGFIIAIIYNLIAVPLAASGYLLPVVGAISMVFNDSIAMLNALTLSRASKKRFLKKNKKSETSNNIKINKKDSEIIE